MRFNRLDHGSTPRVLGGYSGMLADPDGQISGGRTQLQLDLHKHDAAMLGPDASGPGGAPSEADTQGVCAQSAVRWD
jgi:hypothetical protein